MEEVSTISDKLLERRRRNDLTVMISSCNVRDIKQIRFMYGFNQNHKTIRGMVDSISEDNLEGAMSQARRSLLKDLRDL